MEFCVKLLSLPLWERGLKSIRYLTMAISMIPVAPLVGAWIEIYYFSCFIYLEAVAPLVGAWIEIPVGTATLPENVVAPLVGAWIEILYARGVLAGSITSLPLWERGLKCKSLFS